MKPHTDTVAVPVAARIAEARARLVAAGLPDADARFDAEVLARTALGWDRAELLTRGRDAEPDGFGDRYHQLIDRRAGREPVAYITGGREFWGLDFAVAPGVLIPRPETEIIVERVLARRAAGLPCRTIVDVGTGSGCIAVALATSLPDTRVIAVDSSGRALAVAAANAARHGVADRVAFVHGDLLTALRGPCDLIVSNPPYVPDGDAASLQPEVVRFEPAAALFGGSDGLDVVRALCRTAAGLLAPDGWLVIEIGAGQAAAVATLAAEAGWGAVEFVPDLAGLARVAILCGPGRRAVDHPAPAPTEVQ